MINLVRIFIFYNSYLFFRGYKLQTKVFVHSGIIKNKNCHYNIYFQSKDGKIVDEIFGVNVPSLIDKV